MKVTEICAKCLYDHQVRKNPDPEYIAKVREIIDGRSDEDTAAVMVYRFNQVHERLFGKPAGYARIKRHDNDLVLSMENSVRKSIEQAEDPLAAALAYARIGNYIDYGAQNDVDETQFLGMFDGAVLKPREMGVYDSFLRNCAKGKTFLLIADNCGEIVLDKLFLEQLQLRFPHLELQVLVRGGEALNDVTVEDAVYVGIGNIAQIVSNGKPIAGTEYALMTQEARRVLDEADVILAKGQGNYESLSGLGRHLFFSFLCKCEYFTSLFDVPLLTGMLIEENA